jgi:hypothetical protein
MSLLWQPKEVAQLEYESLRESVLRGEQVEADQVAVRFARWGLAGLLADGRSEPLWQVSLSALPRPPWTPHQDPRQEQLAAAFAWLLKVDRES